LSATGYKAEEIGRTVSSREGEGQDAFGGLSQPTLNTLLNLIKGLRMFGNDEHDNLRLTK
jgi:hypothetical protein